LEQSALPSGNLLFLKAEKLKLTISLPHAQAAMDQKAKKTLGIKLIKTLFFY
jgi:hypothetical protein